MKHWLIFLSAIYLLCPLTSEQNRRRVFLSVRHRRHYPQISRFVCESLLTTKTSKSQTLDKQRNCSTFGHIYIRSVGFLRKGRRLMTHDDKMPLTTSINLPFQQLYTHGLSQKRLYGPLSIFWQPLLLLSLSRPKHGLECVEFAKYL